MAKPAVAITPPARAGSSRRWHNSLPAWIVDEAGYARLSQSIRQTLQAIADACDPPKPHGDGSLTVAFGGQPLVKAAGCSSRTFWRHVRQLIGRGYVVQIGRGGKYGGRNYANQYGIPGARGTLDARRCRPCMQRMVRHADGKFRPEVLEPGVQATLWVQEGPVDNLSDSCEQVASCSHPPCQNGTGGSVNLSRGPCQNGTPPYPHGSPYEKNNHEAGLQAPRMWITPPPGSRDQKNNNGARREKRRQRRRRGGTHVDADDITSTPRLLNLFRAYVNKGIVQDSQHDRLLFFAMAEHVLSYRDDDDRPPINPGGMFASNVRNGRWLYATPEYQRVARRRLRDFARGQEGCR